MIIKKLVLISLIALFGFATLFSISCSDSDEEKATRLVKMFLSCMKKYEKVKTKNPTDFESRDIGSGRYRVTFIMGYIDKKTFLDYTRRELIVDVDKRTILDFGGIRYSIGKTCDDITALPKAKEEDLLKY